MENGAAPTQAVVAGLRLLSLLDARIPGRVEGLYLTGSAVLGDFRPQSDIDLILVTQSPLNPAETTALRRLHRRLLLSDRRHYDILCATFSELRRPPDQARPGFYACGLRAGIGAAGKHPVTWANLARHGESLRGPARAELGVYDDDAELRSWCRGNLRRYWRDWWARSLSPGHWRSAWALTPHACIWGALGVARIHHTIRTGEIASKTMAAATALEEWPARHRLAAREARRLRLREGGPSFFASAFARRRALLEAVGHVIETQGAP